MKAMVLEGINQPVVLQDVPDLQLGENEVIVALSAAALNHRDVWIQKGQYAGLKFPIILGSDGAGVVAQVGSAVSRNWLGKEVIINPGMDWGDNLRAQTRQFKILGLPDNGTFAQAVKAPAENLFEKPAHLSFEQAATLPLGGVTAYRSLITRGQLKAGERVLITGVGGGVAILAFQFALATGAHVYVTSGSDAKLDRAKQLGAIGGANYRAEDWDKQLRAQVDGFDVIVDSAGGEGFSKFLELAAPGGRIISFGATLGSPKSFDLRRIFWKQLDLCGSTMGTPEDFARMVELVEAKRIQPVVDKVFPLADAQAALDRMSAAEQFGKIVLSIA